MDVTHGLLSRLVKSKSIERVLAPIASQVSLLMILNDVGAKDNSENEESSFGISSCVQKMIWAIDGFVAVGQEQICSSTDVVFNNKMSAACETLELSKSQLFVAGQNVSALPKSPHSQSMLMRAAKDVLQAVLRVLLVADDLKVRKSVQAIGLVEEKVRRISSIRQAQDLVPEFKELTEAILYTTTLVSQRQKDLVSKTQYEQLAVAMSVLRKGVSSLCMAVQTFLKYPQNPQALVSKEQVAIQTLNTLADMREVLESGPPSDLDVEEPGHFVKHIDKVLDGLSEVNRIDLSPDTEVWVASIVRHAMGVALLCQGTYRHLITLTCQRILQSKFRLFELREARKHSPNLAEIRLDYDNVCETLLDEFCEVEKHVNMALLNLIVDICCFTSQPVELLAKAALHRQQEDIKDFGNCPLANDFSLHSEKVCQVASMAAASSMDGKKVRSIRIAISRLEQLDPEVIPAVVAVIRFPTDMVTVRHLKRLVQEWGKEMELLVQTLHSMIEPVIFMNAAEQRIRQSINAIRGCLTEHDSPGLKCSLRKLLAHAQQMIQVANNIVDHHVDPIFRNGLLVFIQRMAEARKGLKEAGQAILEDPMHPRLTDTLQRRMNLLVDAASDLRQGLKGDNHVDVLSPARENVRSRHLCMSRKAVTTGKVRQQSDMPPASIEDHASHSEPAKSVKQSQVDVVHRENRMPSQVAAPALLTASTAATSTDTDIYMSSVLPGAVMSNSNSASCVKKLELSKESNEVKTMDNKLGISLSKSCQKQKGEVSRLVQVCGEGLMAAATAGDGMALAGRSADMLGWTSHLVEAALCLLDHCHQISRRSEVQELAVELDRVAPRVIEMARFVMAGDVGQLDSLKELIGGWIDIYNRLRILIDVATGDWLVLMEQVVESVSAKDTANLKQLLSEVDCNYREMNQLLKRAQKLEGCHVSGGVHILQFLHDSQSELENLTATLKTSADCLATSSSAAGDVDGLPRTQLVQHARDWCTLMACLVAEFDYIANAYADAGRATLGVPITVGATGCGASRVFSSCDNKVAALLEAETAHLKDILYCFSSSDSSTKKRSDDLKESLSEIMKEVAETARSPMDGSALAQAQLFARLDTSLARSRWTEKALEIEQLITRHCLKFSAPVSNLIFLATATATSGSHLEAVQREASAVSEKLKSATQKVLQAIQLSAELPLRATVRRCLDELNSLLTTVTETAVVCASDTGSRPKHKETDLHQAAVHWGAKVYHLINVLRSMNDVKPSVVEGLERCFSTQFPLPSPRPGQQLSSNHTADSASVSSREKQGRAVTDPLAAWTASSPVSGISDPVLPDVMASPYRRSALYASWLASAKYLSTEAAGWEGEDDNYFVRTVQGMAKDCQQMADFSRGKNSLKDSSEMALVGLALAASGKELVTFTRCLQAMCQQQRLAEEVKHAGEKIATNSTQLRIVASVLHNAPDNPEGDCILARNAANLVQAVREMFSIAEGVSVASLLEPRDGVEGDSQVVDLLTRWQKKLASYRIQQSKISDVDELGLRRMEIHNPPSLVQIAECNTPSRYHE